MQPDNAAADAANWALKMRDAVAVSANAKTDNRNVQQPTHHGSS